MTDNSNDTTVVNLNDLLEPGCRVDLATFPRIVKGLDTSPYAGKHVQLKGCAPTWAHLMVAGHLFDSVKSIDFLIDDGKLGKSVRVYSKK
jgi:hypothetical protein